MRPLLLAPTVLALGGLPAMAQTRTGDGSFYALPAGADTATLLSIMSTNADIARSESGGTMAMTLAPGDLTPGTGGSVTDAQGNVFTLPWKGGDWGESMGQPMENGQPIGDGTGWVAAIRVVNGVACFENAKGLGWGCQGSGTWVADPGGASNVATTPQTTPATIGQNAAPPAAPATPQPGPNVQACPVPPPAALASYNTEVIGGPIDLKGKVWKAIPGANVTQNADGSVTIAGGGSTYNSQVGTVNTISGGFYARATLSWTGDAQWLPGNGWPAFWATNTAAGLGMTNVEADFLEAMGGVTGGLINWLPDGSNTNPGISPPTLPVPAGTDFSQPHTYGFLSLPATANSQGNAIWYFDGQQTRSIPINPGGGEFSALATEPLKIMVGSGTVNPMTVYDVEVWQASASGVAGNGPMTTAAVYCPGNDGSKGPPATTTSVTPATPPATIANASHHSGHQGTLITAQTATPPATTPASDPAVQTPSFDTTALDAAARAQEAATQAAIAAADAQTPANAALVQQAVTAGQQADSILAGVLAAMQSGK